VITFYLVLFGGIFSVVGTVALLDWIGRRQHRRHQGVNR
jgi:hypothetical protein